MITIIHNRLQLNILTYITQVTKLDTERKGTCLCNHCDKEICAKVERIRIHLKKCFKRNAVCNPTACSFTLLLDGWSNVNKDALLTFTQVKLHFC